MNSSFLHLRNYFKKINKIIDCSSNHVQALIVTPTRELSLQIAYVIKSIGEYLDAHVTTCTGGTSVKEDIQHL